MAAPERFGPYLLLDRINVGGMAEVFRGKHEGVAGFERLVALKRILPSVSADPDFIDMFVDEAKIAVQLQHANIAQTYDLGEVDGRYYIALEYVSGVDLKTLWDRAKRRKRLLPVAMSAYIIQKVCEGLDAAHRKRDEQGREIGLVHRDVSPHNILCSFEGEVKIIDFGIAKVSNKVSKTHAGALKGKFGYMSPEQVRGLELDRRSDIFACGTVLAELVTGRRLFSADSDFSMLEKVRKADFRRPSELNPRLDPALEAIALRALRRDPAERYPWASDMADDLNRYLYETGQRFGRTDLATYMRRHFEVEMNAERTRFERYRKAAVPAAPPPPSPPLPEPSRGTPSIVAAPRSEVRVPPVVAERPEPRADRPPERRTVVEPSRVAAAPSPAPAAALVEPFPEGTAPGTGTGTSVAGVPNAPARLPTWAAMLIGALAVIALASLGALAWVLTAEDAPVLRTPEPGHRRAPGALPGEPARRPP